MTAKQQHESEVRKGRDQFAQDILACVAREDRPTYKQIGFNHVR